MKNLEEFQEHAKKKYRGIWQLQAALGAPEKSVEGKELDINDNEDLQAPARANKGQSISKRLCKTNLKIAGFRGFVRKISSPKNQSTAADSLYFDALFLSANEVASMHDPVQKLNFLQ